MAINAATVLAWRKPSVEEFVAKFTKYYTETYDNSDLVVFNMGLRFNGTSGMFGEDVSNDPHKGEPFTPCVYACHAPLFRIGVGGRFEDIFIGGLPYYRAGVRTKLPLLPDRPEFSEWYDFIFHPTDSPWAVITPKVQSVYKDGRRVCWYVTDMELDHGWVANLAVASRFPSERPRAFGTWLAIKDKVGPKEALISAAMYSDLGDKRYIVSSQFDGHFFLPLYSSYPDTGYADPCPRWLKNGLNIDLKSGPLGNPKRVFSQALWGTETSKSGIEWKASLRKFFPPTEKIVTPTFKCSIPDIINLDTLMKGTQEFTAQYA